MNKSSSLLKALSLALCLFMALGVAACAAPPEQAAPTPEPAPEATPEPTPEPTPSKFTPGSYTTTGKGMAGDVEVTTTFSADAITDIVVGNHSETAGISDPAIERLPQAIIETQSLAVDTIAGATLTSNAIIAAVKEAVIQAGGNPDEMMEASGGAGASETIHETADVLVIGGGLTGLSAAVSARENGAEVILIEKLPALGGSSAFSGGSVGAAGSVIQKEHGIEDSAKAWRTLWEERQNMSLSPNANYPDYERVDWLIGQGPELIEWMISLGVEYQKPVGYGVDTVERLHNIVPLDEVGGGAGLIKYLTKAAEEKGVTIMLETKATELIENGGAITGALVETPNGSGSIEAKAVILATGGFAQSPELMKRFIPSMPEISSSSSSGNTGDGILMAEKVGAALYEDPWIIGLYTSVAPGSPLNNLAYIGNLYVGSDGKRFMNEAQHYAMITNDVIKQGGVAYMIMDSSNADLAGLIEANLGEFAFKGETFEELAQAAGLDKDAFAKTMNDYNGYAKAGEDKEFKKDKSMLFEVATAPYYAIKVKPNSMGTFGGMKTNITGEVLNTNGDVIPGLYAGGECANRVYYNQVYMTGSSLAVASTTGRFAGKSAAEFAK